jgi:negative regulator of flagellin synthesis FlgM
MAIEITGRTGGPTFIKTSPKADVEGGKKVAVTATEKDDSVDLTSTNQEIKKAFSPSSATPVDIDRVNSVKKAVAEGSYAINAERTAKKLIQFEKLIPQENSS